MNEQQVNAILEKHRDRLLGTDGVYGCGLGRASDYGLGEGACIVVHGAASARETIAPALDGAPVQFIEAGPIELERLE